MSSLTFSLALMIHNGTWVICKSFFPPLMHGKTRREALLSAKIKISKENWVFSKIFKKWNFLEKLAHFQFSTSIPISVLTFLLIFIWLFLSFHFEIRALCIWESVETPPIVSIFLACCWGSKKRRRLGYLWYSVSNVYGIPL